MRLLSSRAIRGFTRVYLHAQTAEDAVTYVTAVILITRKKKTEDPLFEHNAGIKMA